MTQETRKKILAVVMVLAAIAVCIIFPRISSFVALAAREIRYFWWLILIVAIGIYLTFFFGRNKK